jgi:hypothetical protein
VSFDFLSLVFFLLVQYREGNGGRGRDGGGGIIFHACLCKVGLVIDCFPFSLGVGICTELTYDL